MKLGINKHKGFTLIELLVVIAIIGILSAVVLASLGTARNKGSDAATQAQLSGARAQGEIYAGANSNSYGGVCAAAVTSGGFGGVAGPGIMKGVLNSSAVSASQISSANPPALAGDATHVTCHDTAGAPVTAWVMEAPLKNGGWWCVDSKGQSKQEGVAILAAATACL